MTALVDRLEQLHTEASDAPWQSYEFTPEDLAESQDEGAFDWWRDETWEKHGPPGEVSRLIIDPDGTRWTTGLPGAIEMTAANAALIVELRNALPALLTALRAAHATLGTIAAHALVSESEFPEDCCDWHCVAESRDLAKDALADFAPLFGEDTTP